MRYIDSFCHFFPKPLWDKLGTMDGAAKDIGSRMRGIPAIFDLERRMQVVDMFRQDKNFTQVLSLGMPPLESLAPSPMSEELAKLGNDGLAELCAKHPDYFTGWLASLPMNSPNAAKELERAVKMGANGVQIHSNINGDPLDEPQYWPVFETAARLDCPMFLHPSRGAFDLPDYKNEKKSKYEIWWTFGWPYETSAAMARIVFSGMLDKLPNLKILAHHLGAMVPYFEGRVGPGWDQLGKRTSDEDYVTLRKNMKKRPLDYFKNDFYVDTAVFGSMAATKCGFEFYPVEKILFASDCPFDPEGGPGYIRETIEIMEKIGLSKADMEAICHGNAEKLLKIKPQS